MFSIFSPKDFLNFYLKYFILSYNFNNLKTHYKTMGNGKSIGIIAGATSILASYVIFYVLYIGKNIILPLIVSIFLIILFTSSYRFFFSHIKNKFFSVLITLLAFSLFFLLVFFIINSQINNFIDEIPRYKDVFLKFAKYINTIPWIDMTSFSFEKIIAQIDFGSFAYFFTGSVTSIVGTIGTIFFYVIFLLAEMKYFKSKLSDILVDKERKRFYNIVLQINQDISSYFLLKFFTAFVNGALSFTILTFFWVDFALFFAFLVFLLDFIPNIGGLFAILIPFLYCFLQFDALYIPFLVLLCLITQQTLMGNFIEPRLMGDRLNISPFVIIFSLIFWWTLWGIAWAFLAVPLMTMLNIIFSKFKTTRPLAIFISQKGEIKKK